jgi:hypothetical protein
LILLLLAYYSAPPPFPDSFTQRNITAMFPFALVSDVLVNGQIVSSRMLGGGMVIFTGNGSISAGNPLLTKVIVYLNTTVTGQTPESVVIKFPGAFLNPPSFDSHGLTGYAALALTRYGDLWNGTTRLKYNQGGPQQIPIYIDENLVDVAGEIQMSSQDVTVAMTTNSLLLSLTWAILSFAVLELRVDSDRRERKQCNENDYRV